MSWKKYLFDSDSLIVANRLHYSPDFCSAFWDWIVAGNKHSILFTIDRVADELKRGNKTDSLRNFIEQHDENFIIKTKDDLDCIVKYGEIQQWANTIWLEGKKRNKTAKALEIFADEKTADPWLVAYANVYGYRIISNETSALQSQTSVKLPDVAKAFGVEIVKLHEVLSTHCAQNFVFKPA